MARAETSIATKVYDATRAEDGPLLASLVCLSKVPAEAFGPEPVDGRDLPIDHRVHLAGYGFCFGVAYALARLEEPWAGEEAWTETAELEAIKAFRWHTTVGGRPEGES